MIDTKHLAELSGISASDEVLSDMEYIIEMIGKITETDFPKVRQNSVSSNMLREDKPSNMSVGNDIVKLSKSGLEIPKIM